MTTTTTLPTTVIGAGAIGGTLAVALLEAGVPVQVVDQDATHIEAIRARGLTVTGGAVERTAWVPAFTLDEGPAVLGRTILAVKGQATGAAMAWVAPRLAPDGFVVSMQNGLSEGEIADAVGPERTVAAFVDLFADVVAPGVVKDGGPGAMSIGEYRGSAGSPRVLALAEDLRLAGDPIVSDNVQGFLWAKLAFGSWSSVTALADVDMYELVDRHRPTMRALATEVTTVALAEGIQPEDFDAYQAMAFAPGAESAAGERVLDACSAWLATQPKARSGVWRDVAVRGRKTEVPSHFLPVLDAAARHGIPTPALHELLRLIDALENGRIGRDEEHLVAFDSAVSRTSAPSGR